MNHWFETHEARLAGALEACATRQAYSAFIESPARRHHPPDAKAKGLAAFKARLGQPFPLTMPGEIGRVGEEISPYTGEPLGITYPAVEVDALYSAMTEAGRGWRKASPRDRVGVCLEMLDRLSHQVFEAAFATMHTAGQAFMLAFAGSGANALDRGLEGLARAWQAMSSVPETATFTRRFGPGEPTTLHKKYRLMPRGIAVVITCASYPSWNAWPALFANLACGNPVVIKPHPGATLSMAMTVETCRGVLAEAGFDPNVLTLAADTVADPVGPALTGHRSTAIIDFTGSAAVGAAIEAHSRHARVYTETSGCNPVILASTDHPDGMFHALALGLCIFSGQMCTTAQNIFVPRAGLVTPDGTLSPEVVAERLTAEIDRLLSDPATAAGICGAIQRKGTLDEIQALATEGQRRWGLVRASTSCAHPQYPRAQTATPLIIRATPADQDLYGREHFGPMAFFIEVDSVDEAIHHATTDARERGCISAYAWAREPERIEQIEEAFAEAGASVGLNLIHQAPINFSAAYSDFHVTGLNPAGNACLTDLAFVADRFRVVQSKIEVQ